MGTPEKTSLNLWQIQIIAMRQKLKPTQETTGDKLTRKYLVQMKNIRPERQKIRQLLRSMLPMEEEQRQLKEEQNLFR